jgi:hypothetical protein
MKALPAAIGAASLASLCLAAQPTPPPDWRAFGAAEVAGQRVELFYLSNDVQRTPDGVTRVWTKALSRPELERAVRQLDAGVSEQVTTRLNRGYIPPLSQMRTFTGDQIAWLAASEQVANDAKLAPTTLVLYEVDCPKQLMRQLRAEVTIKSRNHSSSTASEWSRIPEEGTMTVLHSLLCTSG